MGAFSAFSKRRAIISGVLLSDHQARIRAGALQGETDSDFCKLLESCYSNSLFSFRLLLLHVASQVYNTVITLPVWHPDSAIYKSAAGYAVSHDDGHIRICPDFFGVISGRKVRHSLSGRKHTSVAFFYRFKTPLASLPSLTNGLRKIKTSAWSGGQIHGLGLYGRPSTSRANAIGMGECLHDQQYAGAGSRGGISRKCSFLYGFIGSFCWHFLSGYLFTTL
jgi:hypothetical protein